MARLTERRSSFAAYARRHTSRIRAHPPMPQTIHCALLRHRLVAEFQNSSCTVSAPTTNMVPATTSRVLVQVNPVRRLSYSKVSKKDYTRSILISRQCSKVYRVVQSKSAVKFPEQYSFATPVSQSRLHIRMLFVPALSMTLA